MMSLRQIFRYAGAAARTRRWIGRLGIAAVLFSQLAAPAQAGTYDNAMGRTSYIALAGDYNGDGQDDLLMKAVPKLIPIPIDDDLSIPVPVKPPAPTFVLLSVSYGNYTLTVNPEAVLVASPTWKPSTRQLSFSGPDGPIASAVRIDASTSAQAAFVVAMGLDGVLQHTGTTPPMVNGALKPTLSVLRSQAAVVAGGSVSTTWASTNATSVAYTCTAGGSGFAGSATMPSVNGSSVPVTASAAWVGYPSTCIWTATGPGGTASVSETLTTVAASVGDSAFFVAQNVPAYMVAGQPYNVSVTMLNSGTSTWTAAELYSLGSQNPGDNLIWRSNNRVALAAAVAPGALATFNFSVIAPQADGAFDFQWRLVRDGVAWFGQPAANVVVSVSGNSGAASDPAPIPVNLSVPHLSNPDAGSLPGGLSVSNGASTYRLDIAVPPGTAGMQPSLSLNYSSVGGNGVPGYGWSLGGFSTIHRCSKTTAQDKVAGRITFEGADRLCLDGQRLVRVNGAAPGVEFAAIDAAYWASDAEYRTEQESFNRVARLANGGFKVESKDGRIHTYGTHAGSAIAAQGLPGAVLLWAIDRTEDRAGNYMQFDYTRNGDTGEYLPYQVKYGGNAGANQAADLVVRLEYEERGSDAQTMYIGGARNDMRKRLAYVRSYLGAAPDGSGGSLARSYALKYRTSATSGRSLLESIESCASSPDMTSTACLPATRFQWGDGGELQMRALPIPALNLARPVPLEMPKVQYEREIYSATPYNEYYADLDGSGKTSIIRNRQWNCERYNPHICTDTLPVVPNTLRIRLPDGRSFDHVLNLPAGMAANAVLNLSFGDFNGDGRDDLVIVDIARNPMPWAFCLNNAGADGTVSFACAGGPSNATAMPRNKLPSILDLRRDRKLHLLIPTDATNNGSDCFIPSPADIPFLHGQPPVTSPSLVCEAIQVTHLDPVPAGTPSWHRDMRFSQGAINLSKGGSPDFYVFSSYLVPVQRFDGGYAHCAPNENPNLNQCQTYYKEWLRVSMCLYKQGGIECRKALEDRRNENIIRHSVSAGDLNGDGLADPLLTVTESQFGFDYNTYVPRTNTCLSKETGTICPPFSGNAPLAFESETALPQLAQLGDFLGDGINRVLAKCPHVWEKPIQICRYTDTGWVARTFAMPTGTTFRAAPVYLDDSGIPVFLGSGDTPSVYTLALPAGQDKLTRVTNGVGHSEEVDYARGDDAGVYQRHPVLDGDVQKPVYPAVAAPPELMVKELRRSNGQGGWLRTRYKYAGYRVHAQGRGSLGFAKTDVIEVATNVTKTTILAQAFPNVGMATRRTAVHGSVVLSDTVETPTFQTFPQASGAKTLFAYNRHSTASTRDLDGSAMGTSDIDYVYGDGWGNLTAQTTTLSGVGQALTSSVKTDFKNDPAAWLLGLPKLVETTKTNLAGASLTRTTSYDYDPSTGWLLKEIVEPNNVLYQVTTTYDRSLNPFGLINAKTESWVDPSCASAQIPAGLDPECKSNKARIVSKTGYDQKGRFGTSVENALGQIERTEFDAATGQVSRKTDINQQTTDSVRDPFGRVRVLRRADGNETRTYWKACAGDCPSGAAVIQITDSFHGDSAASPRIGAPQVDYLDTAGHVVRQLRWGFDGTRIVTDHRYDDAGRLTATDHPRFDVASAGSYLAKRQVYDDLNRVTSSFALDEALVERESKTTYAGLTRTFTNPKLSDGKYQTRIETRNVGQQLIQVQDARGKLTKFAYEPFGNLNQTIDPNGNVIDVGYDLLGRRIKLHDPDMGLIEYRVDPVGQTWLQTSPLQRAPYAAASTSFKYDLLGRKTARFETDLVSRWVYDPANGVGNIGESYTVTAGQKDYRHVHTYDAKGRALLNTLYLSDGSYTNQVKYDAWGRPVSEIYQRSGTTVGMPKVFATRYNNMGYMARVERAGQVLWKVLEQNAANLPTTVLLGNGLTQKRSYNKATGRLDSGTLHDGASVALLQEGYEYDAIGSVSKRLAYWDAASGDKFEETFTYDALNRLETSTIGPAVQTFKYDDGGNVTSKTNTANNGTYRYPPQGAGAVRPHGVNSIDGMPGQFDYDANGNLLKGAGRSIEWTSFNMPRSIGKGDPLTGPKSTFVYGPDHQRARQDRRDGSSVVYAGSQEVETKDGVVTVKTYWPNGIGVEIDRGAAATELRWMHMDRQGSPIAISNQAGAVTEKLAYDSWGKRRNLNDTGTPDALDGKTDNRGYTGHEMLDQLDLVHMNGRVYDPLLARFLSADLVLEDPMNGQSYNRYSYVLNNPTNLTDPTGFASWGSGGWPVDVTQSMNVTSWFNAQPMNVAFNASAREFVQETAGAAVNALKDPGKWLSDKNIAANKRAAEEKGYTLTDFTFKNDKGDQQTIIVTTREADQRIILIQPSETDLYRTSLSQNGIAGYTTITSHGHGTRVSGMNGLQLSELIKQSNGWTAGQPIILDACTTGFPVKGIASQLAGALGTLVTAPTAQSWTYPLWLGGGSIGTGAYLPMSDGFIGSRIPAVNTQQPWRTFDQTGQVVSETATAPGR